MKQKGVRLSESKSTEAYCGCSHAGADPEERVTTGQLLLQSYYEDQDRAMRLGGLHHSSLPGGLASLAQHSASATPENSSDALTLYPWTSQYLLGVQHCALSLGSDLFNPHHWRRAT